MTRVIDQIAEFAVSTSFGDLPTGASSMVVDAITDAYGVGVAGSQEDAAKAVLRVIGTSPGSSPIPLLGTDLTSSELDASLYHGTAIHALDYDDTAHPAYAHPSAHLVPVLLSLSLSGEVSGQTLITAYLLGFEVENKLGRSLNMDHYLHGWHATGTFGTLASAVTAAKILRLNVPTTRSAIAIAASLAGGIRANFGTMTKPLHAGLAARNGVFAARLASTGFTASDNAFDGRFGFLDVFGGEHRDLDCWSALGHEWEISDPHGLAIKPYPSCGATHPAIEAALLARADLGDERIDTVRVGTNTFTSDILIYDAPAEPLEGKFSMQYCVASALTNGWVDLRTFTIASIGDPPTRELMKRVTLYVDDDVRENSEFGAVITVRTVGGRQIRRIVPLAKGKPERWMDESDRRSKFVDCAAPITGPIRAVAIFRALQELASRDDASYLAHLWQDSRSFVQSGAGSMP
jgi:2-methylcitrate dehydratase PrpD